MLTRGACTALQDASRVYTGLRSPFVVQSMSTDIIHRLLCHDWRVAILSRHNLRRCIWLLLFSAFSLRRFLVQSHQYFFVRPQNTVRSCSLYLLPRWAAHTERTYMSHICTIYVRSVWEYTAYRISYLQAKWTQGVHSQHQFVFSISKKRGIKTIIMTVKLKLLHMEEFDIRRQRCSAKLKPMPFGDLWRRRRRRAACSNHARMFSLGARRLISFVCLFVCHTTWSSHARVTVMTCEFNVRPDKWPVSYHTRSKHRNENKTFTPHRPNARLCHYRLIHLIMILCLDFWPLTLKTLSSCFHWTITFLCWYDTIFIIN